MSKPEDRLNPKCPDGPWSIFEAWGGRSWFPPVTEKETEDVGKVQRDNNLNGKRK
jgi:hypothetical protein